MQHKLEVSMRSPFSTAFWLAAGVILSVAITRPIMLSIEREPEPPRYVVEFSPEMTWPHARKWEGGSI